MTVLKNIPNTYFQFYQLLLFYNAITIIITTIMKGLPIATRMTSSSAVLPTVILLQQLLLLQY